jgi:hypothetical protein
MIPKAKVVIPYAPLGPDYSPRRVSRLMSLFCPLLAVRPIPKISKHSTYA